MNDRVYHQLSLEFHRARLGAMRAEVDDLVRNRPPSLLAGDTLAPPQIRTMISRGIRSVPIYQISVRSPRYDDFNRLVSPADRAWQAHLGGDRGWRTKADLPLIALYQLGTAYFVKDGNRRVAEARARGQVFLLARVTECLVDNPPDDVSDALTLLLREEYQAFQSATHLAQLHPAPQIVCTALGGYAELLAHIAAHGSSLNADLDRSSEHYATAISWYDTIYTPIVGAIRRLGVLEYFPGHSETDLYLWAVDRSLRLLRPTTSSVSRNFPWLEAIMSVVAERVTRDA